jgi:hypothetical protein
MGAIALAILTVGLLSIKSKSGHEATVADGLLFLLLFILTVFAAWRGW